MAKRRRRKPLPEPCLIDIEAMSHEGRGIGRIDGKTVFVFGGLPGEQVKIQFRKSNRNYDEASVVDVIRPSPLRIQPKCNFFNVCGGCSLQHLDNAAQIEAKQQSLVEMMTQAGVEIGQLIPPLRSQPWGYRRRARLGVKYVRKKSRVLVGFRERNAPFLADMSRCEVLIPEVGHRLADFAQLIEGLEARESIPQIEVAADDRQVALVFRHLKPLSDADSARLIEFGKQNRFWIQLQPAGPDSISNLYPEHQDLFIHPLVDENIEIRFNAVDFTQVNAELNQKMVAQALQFLDLQASDRVLDLFCGLGNFTLPMARRSKSVVGVEGDAAMVGRARQNALDNAVDNSDYFVADLSQPDPGAEWMRRSYDKVLLDPPRLGAQALSRSISDFNAKTIVYVSCAPASLVRDSKIICENGYRLSHLGIMDMFPQTAHVESMAVFKR